MTAPTRREVLIGSAALGVGAVGGAVGGGVLVRGRTDRDEDVGAGETLPFHGKHQAGIDTPPQAFATFLGFDLHPEVEAEGLRRMMRLLSDDAARLTTGQPALADTEPEMAHIPARLTVTFGFGPEFIRRAGGAGADRVKPLPSFVIDRLEDRWSGGDLLVHVGADDPTTLAHAVRMLLKDARAFASVRWSQQGFREARGSRPDGSTMRNLFGQLDGTSNPADLDQHVWIDDDSWLAGGTTAVLRRIVMDLDDWDRVDRPARELSTGRRLDTGAPLTGEHEHDEPDFEARNQVGMRIIPEFSHMARAHRAGTSILRRGYNYDGPASGTSSDSGQIFVAYQADVARQFVPIQESLAELDLLNEWTTPIGSAVFAIPPGCAEGGYVGETLLD